MSLVFPNNISAKEMGVSHLSDANPLYQAAWMVAINLQAIRDHYNPNNDKDGFKINVHVGYRSPDKNKSVGGSSTSQHLTAEAVDFSCYGSKPLHEIFNDLKNGKIELPFEISQLILEESRINKGQWGWIHLGVRTQQWIESRKRLKKNDQTQFTLMVSGDYYTATSDAKSIASL